MNRLLKLSTVLCASISILGCATVGTKQGVVESKKRSSGFMGLATAADIETEYETAFKDAQQIVIGGFKVGFNETKELVEKKGGGLFDGPSRDSTGQVKLDGVSSSAQQQITNRAYEKFVTLLQDNGYEILPTSTFTSIPDYKNVNQTEFPYLDDKSGLFSSYGTGMVYSPTAMGNVQPFFPNEVDPSGMFSGFQVMGITNASSNFAKYSPARLVNVSLTLDFAAAADTGMFALRALEIGQAMSVDTGVLGSTSGSTGVYAHRTGNIKLGQPIVSEVEFAEIEDVTNEAAAGARIATNMAFGFLKGGLLGASTASQAQTREYVFHADEGKYVQAADDIIEKALVGMVEKMVSIR